MKNKRLFLTGFFCSSALLLLGLGCGTEQGGSSAQTPPVAPATAEKAATVPPLPEGVTLHKDKDIQGLWLAPGFNFQGYDTLYIENSEFRAVVRNNERTMREFALSSLQMQFLMAARTTGLFKTVAISPNDVPGGGRCLRLHNVIIEYEKGGGGARYWAGTFGAGQPVIKIRGSFYDGDQLVCVFEAKRSGESPIARLDGGFMSDREIQQYDIHDLTSDMADCMRRNAGLPPLR